MTHRVVYSTDNRHYLFSVHASKGGREYIDCKSKGFHDRYLPDDHDYKNILSFLAADQAADRAAVIAKQQKLLCRP